MPHNSNIATKLSALLLLLRRSGRHSAAAVQQIHTQILTHNLSMDPTLSTHLLLLYSRCPSSLLTSARKLFDQMPQRTTLSFNILISSNTQLSLFPQSISLFSLLLDSNLTPDHFTLPPLFKSCAALRFVSYGIGLHCWVFKLGLDSHVVVMGSLLDMYVKFERTGDARRVFDEMGVRDDCVWNSMFVGFARAGLSDEAVELFQRLKLEGGEISVMAIPSLLSVLGKSGNLRKGKELHGRVVRSLMFDRDVVVGNSLIEMYGKCGCVEDSYKVFLMMGHQQNIITWSTLISCYGVHGKGKEALNLYNEMIERRITPNSITFTSILSSCSHSGLVSEGQALFHSMHRDFGVSPSVEHYACIVGLLGRAGCIENALKIIEDMPMEPTASIWGALLSACVMHRNIKTAEIAAQKLFELEPRNCSNYVALCGVYEMVGMLDDVAKMRVRMRDLGMVKTSGCSWINMKGKVHAFYQGDIYVSSGERVCDILDGLCKIMAMGSDEELN